MSTQSLVPITLPKDLQEGSQSFIGQWLKNPGDHVEIHEPLLEVSTDKAVVEVPSPVSGVLTEIIKQKDEEIQAGEILGQIEASTPSASFKDHVELSTKQMFNQSASGKQKNELSPAVRRLVKQHAIDVSQLAGTGKDGRITLQDVSDFIDGKQTESAAPTSHLPSHNINHTGLRKSIAKHMVDSLSHSPHVTALFEANMSAVMKHREQHKQKFKDQGVALTYTAYIVEATVKSLKTVPQVNSRWHGEHLEVFDIYNIGVGTALGDKGIVVPVIHNAQDLDLFDIAKALQELTQKARDNKLEPKDMHDGTFTISNHGVSGSLLAAPIIINQPQAAILGVGKMEKRAVVIEDNGNDKIEILPMAYVTLSVDHRILDAYNTNKFLSCFVDALNKY